MAKNSNAFVCEQIIVSTKIHRSRKVLAFNSAQLVQNFFFFSVILGVGIKITPIALLDLCALLLLAFFGPSKRGATLSGWGVLLVAYGMLTFAVGAFFACDTKTALNSARQFVLIASLAFLPSTISENNAASFLKGGLFLLGLSIFLPLYGFFCQFPVAWWQDWLFTGTAYASFGVFISVLAIIVFARKHSFIKGILSIAAGLIVAVLWDSRTSTLMILSALPVLLVMQRRALQIGITGLLLVSLLALATSITSLDEQVESLKLTYTESEDRDMDRKQQNAAVLLLIKKDPLHALLGKGGYSHQFDMLHYGVDYTDKVRPTGLPAIVFDGGIIFLGLILCSSIAAAVNVYYAGRGCGLMLLSPYLLIAFSLIISLVTNVTGCVLWWWIILPKGFAYALTIHLKRRTQFTTLRTAALAA